MNSLAEKNLVIKWFNHIDTLGQVSKDIVEENGEIMEIFEEDGKEIKRELGLSNYNWALDRAKTWDYSKPREIE